MNRAGQHATAMLVALGWAASGMFVSAAEEKIPAASDSLATAKREFEALKATRAEGLQNKQELPRIAAPELRPPSPPLETRNASKSPLPEKTSANWLVDAMEKPTESRKGRERERDRSRESDRDRPGTEGPEADSRRDEDAMNAARRDASSRDNEDRKAPPPNPLAQFLGAWMTPQDYQLLKPGLEQAFAGERSIPGVPPGAGVASPLDTTLAGLLDGAKGGLNGSGNNPPPRPRENPYLASMTAPLPPASAPVPVVSPPSSTLPPAVAPMPPPSKSPIPDFARPDPDGKYFKQLKRF